MIVFALFFAAVGATIAIAAQPQPHMVNAKSLLTQARTELNAAAPDKGGYRDKAIQFTQSAIDNVSAGISYANQHPN
jgi:hypothetical protein